MWLNEIKTPFSLKRNEKKSFLLRELNKLTKVHYDRCVEYKNILNALYPKAIVKTSNFFNGKRSIDIKLSYFNELTQMPFIPIQLFKLLELKSIHDQAVFKVLLSSGTTSKEAAKIFLDKTTALIQSKVLSAIVTSFIGKCRMPMV